MRLVQRSFAILTLAFVAALPGAASAQVPDLTGTWEGKLNCKGFAEGNPRKLKADAVVLIGHDLVDNLVEAEMSFDTELGPLFLTGCGFAVGDPDDPERGRAGIGAGEAPFQPFFTGDFSKIVTFAEKPSGVSGKISGAIFLGVRPTELLTCKLKVKRTSQGDPGVSACPPPP